MHLRHLIISFFLLSLAGISIAMVSSFLVSWESLSQHYGSPPSPSRDLLSGQNESPFTVLALTTGHQEEFLKENGEAQTQSFIYPIGTLLAEFVDPRSESVAHFAAGSCTSYIALRRPDLVLTQSGSRRITGNANERLTKAYHLGIPVTHTPSTGSVAIFMPGQGARDLGHLAYVEAIQEDGSLIVSEMAFESDYMISYRVISPRLVSAYLPLEKI